MVGRQSIAKDDKDNLQFMIMNLLNDFLNGAWTKLWTVASN